MKILLIGNFTMTYAIDNWLNPMKKMYDVTYVSVSILSRLFSKKYLEQYIYSIVRNKKFDYVFVYSDGLNELLSEKFYEVLRIENKLIVFHADDEPEKWYKNNEKFDHRYNLIATHSKRGLQKRIDKPDYKGNSFYLPWGYNPECFYKINEVKKTNDVIFMGANFYRNGEYYFDGDIRQKVLTEIHYFCKSKGYIFKVYGAGWDKHPILSECNGGWLKKDDLIKVINEAKIVLNLGFSADNKMDAYHTKLKHFEIAGCGTFQIVNMNPELLELFGQNLGYFTNIDELIEEINTNLTNEKIREEKANIVLNESINHHTIYHRIQYMFDYANKYFNIGKSFINESEYKIKTIPIQKSDNLIDVIESINDLSEFDAVHFIDKKLHVNDINYSLITPYLKANDIIEVESLVVLGTTDLDKEEYFYRRYMDDNAVVLQGRINVNSLDNSKLLSEELIGINKLQSFYPIMNYIVKKSRLTEFLKIINDKNDDYLNQIVDIRTKMVINDVLLETNNREIYDEISFKVSQLINLTNKNKKIAFYGAKGFFVDKIKKIIIEKNNFNLNNIYFIDKGMAGKSLYNADNNKLDIRIFSYDDLLNEKIQPDIIVITSIYIGDIIYDILRDYETKVLLLPIYDLEHPNWDFM